MNTFYKYIRGIATGMTLLAWGINPETAAIVGAVSAVVAIGMASFSLGAAIHEKKNP